MSIYSALIDPFLKEIRILMPRFSGMERGQRVLDVCCGTGDQVFHYGREGIIAWGIDSNIQMIEVAKKKKEELGQSDVFFQIADAKKLPFENSFFDFASICFGLHEIEKGGKEKVIFEMKRVVKKEGALVFVDFKAPLPKRVISYLIQAVEYSVGRKHYEGFKEYLELGGIPGLLEKNKLREEKRDYIKDNLAVIIKAKNN